MNATQEVHFSLSGAATIAAIGNGDGESQESYSGNTVHLFQGRAIIVLRSTHEAGDVRLTAKAESLNASSIAIDSRLPAIKKQELR